MDKEEIIKFLKEEIEKCDNIGTMYKEKRVYIKVLNFINSEQLGEAENVSHQKDDESNYVCTSVVLCPHKKTFPNCGDCVYLEEE